MTETFLVLDDGSDRSGLLRARGFDEVLRPNFDQRDLSGDEAVAPADWRTVAMIVDGGAPLAVGVCDRYPGASITMLTYLATRQGHQNAGLGGRMLRELRRYWADRPETGPVVAEVHDPDAWGDEDPMAVRRLRFYARHGSYLLQTPGPWVAPILSPGAPREGGYRLVVVDGVSPGGVVAAEDMGRWVDAYFTWWEGRPPTDEDYARVRHDITCGPSLVLPLDDWSPGPVLEPSAARR